MLVRLDDVDFRFCPKWIPQEDHPALHPATSEFRVTDLGVCLLILLFLEYADMLDFLCVHSRQLCCFHNSSTGRIAVRNVELNNLTVQEMKASLYTLTACSAACLIGRNGLTLSHGLSPGENQIYLDTRCGREVFCAGKHSTQGQFSSICRV